MRRLAQIAFVTVLATLISAAVGRAETKVTISETHLCCGMCLTAVTATLKDMPGVKHTSSQEAKTIEIVAENNDAAQKAVDALAAAGFYGKIDNATIKFRPVNAPQGSVKKLEVSGVHNCCGACTRAIQSALSKVEGVKSNTVKAREGSFAVEGEFKPGDLVDALLKSGFYCQVK
jgi:periplasmic mercuric ion binding protein